MTASYGYDPLGNLIAQTVNGATTNYQVDPVGLGDVVATFNGSGGLMSHYTYGSGLISEVNTSGVAYYYNFNLQGSTVSITNPTGGSANQYSYDPFGQVATKSEGIANPFTFGGQFGVMNNGSGFLICVPAIMIPSRDSSSRTIH